MKTQSDKIQNFELQKIKDSLLDIFLKIRLKQTNTGHTITLIEYNQKAKRLLKIEDETKIDIIHTLNTELSSKINWQEKLISVYSDKKDSNIEITNENQDSTFQISLIDLSDSIVMLNIRKIKKQESAQYFSDEKFTKAFHANPALMAITTLEGHAVDLNESFIKTIGYTREEFINKGICATDLIESPETLEEIKQKIRANGSVRNLDITILTKNAEKLYCSFSADYIKSPESTYILVVINNLSKLHQLTLRLNMAMNTARLAWYEFDMIEGNVTAGDNKAHMLGYNPADYKNKHYSKWTDLIHPDDYEPVMESMKACITMKTDLYQVDYRIKRADGKYAWFFDRGTVCEYTIGGKPKRMTGIVIDISEQKATERKLKETLKDYEHATNNVRSIIWKTEISKDGKFINSFISKVADKLLGYEGESLNHDLYKYLSHIHPDDKEKTLENVQKGMQPGEKSEFEYRIIKKNGEVAWLFTQESTEVDDEGRIFAFGVTMDMSHRKLAEIEIEKQQKFLHKLFDTIPSMIAVKDESGKYTNVNTRFADFYNLEPKDILGKHDDEFIEKSWADELSKNDKSIIREGVPVYYNISHETETEKLYFEVSKAPIKNPETNQNQLLLVSNNITAQVLAKQQIQQKTKELLMLTEHVDIQIWYLKDAETYGSVNKAHANFLGKERYEIGHKKITSLFNQEKAEAYIKSNQICFSEKRTLQLNEWNERSDGAKRFLKVTKTPMIEPNGEASFVICTARDISEEYHAEMKLKNAMHFNKLLIETSPIGILVYRTRGKCILVNNAAIKIVGAKTEKEVIDNNVYTIQSWKKNNLTEYFDQALGSKERVHASRYMTTSYGKSLWIDFVFQQIDYQGTPHVMVIVDDITEIKEQELNIQRNLSRQKTLSSIAFELSELKDFNKNINKSLETIGEFMDVSRVYVFRNAEDNSSYSNVFEWCNKGIEKQINNLQNISYNKNPEWKQNLAANSPIYTDNINKLAPELRKELEPQGIKAMMVYPLFIFKKFSGFIGFDENITNRNWSEDDFEFLQTISHIIANTYERKIIGDNLRESEEMFKKITSGAMDGIILIDSTGKVNYWNPAAQTIFGYSRSEMTGNDLHKLLPSKDDGQKYEANKIQFANTGTGNAIGKNIELKAYQKGGIPIDIELSLSSLKIKGEWHALGIVRNISERKYAENQLKTLSKAVEYASASIVITDINGDIEYVNKEFFETTGYSKEEVLGQNPRILSSGKHPKSFYKNLWDTITEGKSWKGEFHNKRKNGETYYESALISSVTDEKGNILHYIGIKEDITQEKLATAELIEAKQNAEMANKAKSDFLANMSHEIRTPMNAVIGFSEILANKIDNKEHKTYLESIQASSKTLLNLINDILDLSKIEAGQMKIQTETVNLKQTIQDITQIFSLKIQQKNLSLVLDIDPNLPNQIIIDELRLRQILLNLLGNAVKFTEEGFIKIIAEKAKNNPDGSIKLIIRVQDSGIGIDPKNQYAIFEAFRQQENHNTRKYGGTGLGLSITKRLIEIQGGKIELDSKLGEGSTFSVIFDNLMTSSEQYTENIPEFSQNQEYRFNQEIVLIVDDVPSNRFLLNSYLAELNLTILEAENGAEAVEIVRQQKPDIILMDLRMPIMNGLDATKEIKQIPSRKDTPIIAVTASSMHFEDKDIKASGFDGFLDKPVSRSQIINELTKYIKPREHIKSAHHKPEENGLIAANICDEHKELIKTHLCKSLIETKNSGNINDIQKLAEQIKAVGNKNNIAAFVKAADALQSASKNFDIESIQEILSRFYRHCN
ncbi:MAG: PAS domain S-box protein [Bacteroidales bacterium]|nr:PAS domain S-box protein [Bacteroidales bacterium]